MIEEKIVQIIPCNINLNAVFYDRDNGEEFKMPVVLFGLSSGGWVECFTFDSDMGVSAIDGRTTNIIRFEMGEADV